MNQNQQIANKIAENIFMDILKELIFLRQNKTNDYGGNIFSTQKKYGEIAMFFDIHRKFGRIENFWFYQNKKQLVKDETILDTLMDLALICINDVIYYKLKKNYKELFEKL